MTEVANALFGPIKRADRPAGEWAVVSQGVLTVYSPWDGVFSESLQTVTWVEPPQAKSLQYAAMMAKNRAGLDEVPIDDDDDEEES